MQIQHHVTSLVEVRIEINNKITHCAVYMSLPLWKCGLKYAPDTVKLGFWDVTSLVEVRIEMYVDFAKIQWSLVTSLVEVRIEISIETPRRIGCRRHFPCGSAD